METNKVMLIMELYNELHHEIRCADGVERLSQAPINEYEASLPKEKREIFRAIRVFRNETAHSCQRPELPDNYLVWVDFLENEIATFKSDNNCN